MDQIIINGKIYFVLPEEPIRDFRIRMKPIILNGYTYWIEEKGEVL